MRLQASSVTTRSATYPSDVAAVFQTVETAGVPGGHAGRFAPSEVQPAGHADDIGDVSFRCDGGQVLVVGAEREPRGVQPPLFHAAQQYLRVAGRTPFPDIDVHSLPVALQHACSVGTLVVVPDTGPDVGVQQVGRHAGRMAVDGLVAEEGDFLHDFRTAFGYVVETHHFAQPGHVGAFGEFPHRIGEELARAVGVEHGGGDARRNGGENADGGCSGLVEKTPQSFGSGHVHHFVRVGYHACGTVRQYRFSEGGGEYHARLDVYVRIHETCRDHQSRAVQRFGSGGRKTFSDCGYPAVPDEYVGTGDRSLLTVRHGTALHQYCFHVVPY